MVSARKRFRQWLDRNGWSLRKAAKKLQIDATYPGKIIAGTRHPGLDLALRIERLTASWDEGPITAHEWSTDRAEES